MKRPALLLSVAWLIHAAAWFLPVVKGGVTLPHGVPGWEAWLIAACALWPCKDVSFDSWYSAALSGVSAITTVLFLLGSPLVIWRGSATLQRVSAWVVLVAFVANSHWFVLFGADRVDLRVGYFLWWLSFAVLAGGLFALSRTHRTDTPNQERTASAATG